MSGGVGYSWFVLAFEADWQGSPETVGVTVDVRATCVPDLEAARANSVELVPTAQRVALSLSVTNPAALDLTSRED